MGARKLMFLKCSCQKPLKKFFERPIFPEKLPAARNFSKFSQHYNKIPILKDKFCRYIQKYAFFVYYKKKSSRISQRILISTCQGNRVVKLMTMWWNSYYSKFGSEILKVIWDIRCYFSYNFLIFFKCYDFTVL